MVYPISIPKESVFYQKTVLLRASATRAKGWMVFLLKTTFSGLEHASISVYSLRGMIVYSVPLSGKQKSIAWDASQSAAGWYIAKLALNGKSYYTNFMLAK
jgi:hypothetical protein